ncbi:hypothetical protein CMUS01_03031 [Colletotrichum musicola]|uniref:Uncharacterized protein n=1 Tax=Colletotrichum musicola TaxID=2175873 RepID=A0A8H6NTY9_9PEZI|nr:hypothetical protein CMUS01_03031 [Colletotrichum musicola]
MQQALLTLLKNSRHGCRMKSSLTGYDTRRLVEAPACQQPSHSCRAATGQRVQKLNHDLESWPGGLQVAASDLNLAAVRPPAEQKDA